MVTRHERVVLTLEDHLSKEIGQAAVATKVFEKTLRDLDGTNVKSGKSTATLGKDVDRLGTASSKTGKSVNVMGNDIDVLGTRSKGTGDSINQLTGRLRLFTDIAATLGPAVVPILGAAVPAIAGLSAQLGATAGAAGVAVLAFNGVGDALKSVNEYQLEPTAQNFNKMQLELEKMGPAGAQFVRFLDSVGPQLSSLQDLARAGIFPGIEDGIESLLTMGPRVESIVENIAGAMGDLAARSGEALAGPRFEAFFDYINQTAGPALMEMGRTLGYVTEGLANMMVSFAPASADFTGGLEAMTQRFAEWSRGLESNDTFQSFLDYVRDAGPMVIDLIGSLIDMLSGISQAAAPIGDVVVPALTAVADVIATIAKSDIGTPLVAGVAAMAALSRASQLWGKLGKSSAGMFVAGQKAALGSIVAVTSAQQRAATSVAGLAKQQAAHRAQMVKTGAALGAVALLATGAAEEMGFATTATLGLAGAMVGGPLGAAVGATVGGFSDLMKYGGGVSDTLDDIKQAADDLDFKTARAGLRELRSEINQYDKGGPLDGIKTTLKDIGFAFEETFAGRGLEAGNSRFRALGEAAGEAKVDILSAKGAISGAVTITDYYGEVVGSTGEALRAAGMSAEEFSRSLGKLNRVLEGRESLRDYEAALDDFTAGLKENGRTMDITTAKGRENEAALDNIAGTAIKVAENLRGTARVEILTRARGDIINMIEKLDLSGGALKRAMRLIEQLDGAGANPKIDADDKPATRKLNAVEGLLGGLNRKTAKPRLDADDKPAKGKINSTDRLLAELTGTTARPKIDADNKPAKSKTNAVDQWLADLTGTTARPKVDVNTDGVLGQINSVRSWLSGIPDENVYVNVKTTRTETTSPGMGPQPNVRSAHGNIVHYAAGDIANGHQPELYRGGVTRVWGEPETKGEAYIPLANDSRRPRARAIAAETVSLLGGKAYFAGGGMAWSDKRPSKKIRQAIDIDADMSRGDVRREYAEFRRVLREAGIELPKNLDRLRDRSMDVAKQFGRVTRRMQRTEKALEAWQETAESVASAVRGLFNNDIFGNGLDGAMLQLQADRNDTAERDALMQTLGGMVSGLGLDTSSAAFQALATEGDMATLRDLDTAQEIRDFFAAFEARTQIQNAAAEYAATAVTGAHIDRLEGTLARQDSTLDRLTKQMERQERQLEGAASRGTQKGSREGVKQGMRDHDRVKSAKAKTR